MVQDSITEAKTNFFQHRDIEEAMKQEIDGLTIKKDMQAPTLIDEEFVSVLNKALDGQPQEPETQNQDDYVPKSPLEKAAKEFVEANSGTFSLRGTTLGNEWYRALANDPELKQQYADLKNQTPKI